MRLDTRAAPSNPPTPALDLVAWGSRRLSQPGGEFRQTLFGSSEDLQTRYSSQEHLGWVCSAAVAENSRSRRRSRFCRRRARFLEQIGGIADGSAHDLWDSLFEHADVWRAPGLPIDSGLRAA